MDFTLTPEQQSFRDEVRSWLKKNLPKDWTSRVQAASDVPREEAYRMVQRNAMKVWDTGADFQAALLADKDVTKALSPDEIKAQFDLGYHTKHVDTIFARVFGTS